MTSIFYIYWLSIYFLLYSGFGFNLVKTNRVVAFIHASTAVLLSGIDIINNGTSYSAPNSFFDMVILNFSLSYFVIDLIYMFFCNINLIYILHHLCSILAISIFPKLGYGADAMIAGIFWGEFTNPIRLAEEYYLIENKFSEKAKNSYIRKFLQYLFYISFLTIRCIILSYVSYNSYYKLIVNLDFKYQLSFFASCGVAMIGGYWWCYKIIRKFI